MRTYIANASLFTGLGILLALPAFAWLTTPLEVYEHDTGRCLYQLEATYLGFGAGERVPCGTHGTLVVERISEIYLSDTL